MPAAFQWVPVLWLAFTGGVNGEKVASGAPTPQSSPGVEIVSGRTNLLEVRPGPRPLLERNPTFQRWVPSYRRGILLDGERRWKAAADAYQQALSELGQAAGLTDEAVFWERAAFKIDLERRRSHALAQSAARDATAVAGAASRAPRNHSSEARGMLPSAGESSRSPTKVLERGRLLRLKMMSVRAATGSIPVALGAETLSALTTALAPSASTAGASTSECRLLLCAARGALGDRSGALQELSRLSPEERGHSARALALAVCQAALGQDDDAMASLAVGVYALGPTSRFLPGQTRELEAANDWDILRGDARFDRIFR